MTIIHQAEVYFIFAFVRKSYQDRLLHEFSSDGKRQRALARFCHGTMELLKRERILMHDSNLENMPDFLSFVKSHDQECVMISEHPGCDRLRLPLSEAVDIASYNSEVSIIIGKDFAVVFSESYTGGRDKYLLAENDKEIMVRKL